MTQNKAIINKIHTIKNMLQQFLQDFIFVLGSLNGTLNLKLFSSLVAGLLRILQIQVNTGQVYDDITHKSFSQHKHSSTHSVRKVSLTNTISLEFLQFCLFVLWLCKCANNHLVSEKNTSHVLFSVTLGRSNVCYILIFGCEDAVQQVLMYNVCLCVCLWSTWKSNFLHSSTTSRMYQNVPECMQNVAECSRMHAECCRMFQNACKMFHNSWACMQFIFGSDRSPRRGNVCVSVCLCDHAQAHSQSLSYGVLKSFRELAQGQQAGNQSHCSAWTWTSWH